MKFTDDDLKRLKERLNDPIDDEIDKSLEALLRRLECAEKLANEFSNWKDIREHLKCDDSCADKPYFDEIRIAIEVWLQSKGEST